jgi:hypothetical protein
MKRLKSDDVRDTSLLAEFSYWLVYNLISIIIMGGVVYYFLGTVGI